MRRVVLVGIALTAACGPKRPPPSFAPDPGLVEQIRELRMSTSIRSCPGESFGAVYTAVLNDGSLIPFETRYDKDHPPRLHVVFLERSSPDATPLEGGGWSTARDPLATAMTGFRLTASLKAKPSVTTSAVVTPDYTCLQHAFGFRGVGAGASGHHRSARLAWRARCRGNRGRRGHERAAGLSRWCGRSWRRRRERQRGRAGRPGWADHDHRSRRGAVSRGPRGRAGAGWRGRRRGRRGKGRSRRERWCRQSPQRSTLRRR